MSQAPTTVERAAEPIVLSAHPRAARSVPRVRAAAGLAGFLITLVLSMRAGVPAWDATARALTAGIVLHLAGWAIAVAVWRQLILAELRAMHDRRLARAQTLAELPANR